MEKEPDDTVENEPRPTPPPFAPDPDLITNLEGGDKPTPEEVRAVIER